MGSGEFQPIGDSDERMFGPRAVIASGFQASEHMTLLAIFEAAGLDDVPICFASTNDRKHPLGSLASRIMNSGQGESSDLERAVVLSGATEAELHRVMDGYRAAGLPRPLWATLTETSVAWPLGTLLSELTAERSAFEGGSAAP